MNKLQKTLLGIGAGAMAVAGMASPVYAGAKEDFPDAEKVAEKIFIGTLKRAKSALNP